MAGDPTAAEWPKHFALVRPVLLPGLGERKACRAGATREAAWTCLVRAGLVYEVAPGACLLRKVTAG